MKKIKSQYAGVSRLANSNIINGIGIVCLGVLSLLSLALLMPTIYQSQVSAITCTGDDYEQCVARSDLAVSALDILVRPAIAVGVQANVQIDITPRLTQAWFANGTVELTVSTNSNSGYSVYMWTMDGSGDLHSADEHDMAVIASLTEPTSADSFTANSWGYRVTPSDNSSSDFYHPIPTTSGTAIIVSNSSASGEITNDSYSIDFGVSVDSNLSSGQYYNSVVLSAVANPITVSSLYDLVYMQDMTAEICETTATHATKQLIDTRDGKAYWVTKLRDGNCWMTQNLALDLSASRTLTPADTNVAVNYTPTDTDATALNGPYSGSEPSDASIYQRSWGKWKNYVMNDPLNVESCGSIKSTQPLCERFTDVSGNEWKSTYIAQTNSAVDTDSKTYDAHYLVGNYYSFYTATAGTGGTGANAGSICPKGWTLPLNNSTNNGSFSNLLNAYGVASTVRSVNNTLTDVTTIYQATVLLRDYSKQLATGAVVNATTGGNLGNGKEEYTVTAGEFNITTSPLYFMRGGAINPRPAYGAMDSAGSAGIYWARSGTDLMQFVTLNVTPSYGVIQSYYGYSLRCLAE